jgi:hypothetical protein
VRQVQQIGCHGSLLGKSRRRCAASLKLAAPPVERHAAIAKFVFIGLICSRNSSAFKEQLANVFTLSFNTPSI